MGIENLFGTAGRIVKAVKEDLSELVKDGEDRVKGAIDDFSKDEALRDIGNTLQQYAAQPAKIKDALKEKAQKYDSRLNDLSRTDPRSAGLCDGVLHAYIGTACKRNPSSKPYSTGVRYGKIIGYGSAASMFLLGGGLVAVLGAVPVVSRAVKYFNEKVSESKSDDKPKA